MTIAVTIKVMDFDAEGVQPSGQGSLKLMPLVLSSTPPAGWHEMFEENWRNHFYMQKRNASAFSNKITMTCTEGELQALIVEVNKVAAVTNEQYSKMMQDQAERRFKAAEKAEEEKKKLADLKSGLKFD